MKSQTKLHRNVILMGFTSLLTDISSEMIYPLIQAFMSMVLTTQQALLGPALGIIEGVAEATASLLKVFFGYYSDRMQQRKLPTIAGYSLSALSKILLLIASAGWYVVLIARFVDRVGKGIRTAPRDALIAESIPKEMHGKAYGFHRAMDFAGATLGVLLCYLISLRFLDPHTQTLTDLTAFYWLFSISLVPALLGVGVLFFVKEERAAVSAPQKEKPRPNLRLTQYDRNLQLFFGAQFIFTLGNSSNQFLLLRSQSLGHALSTVILMYLVFNLASTLLSTFFGAMSDRIGKKRILMAGYLLYAVVYSAFGLVTTKTNGALWLLWILYGVYYAMTEGVEKAFVASIAPAASKATALGFYHTIVGVGLLPASVIAGLLFAWQPAAPFLVGGVLSLCAVAVLGFWVHEKQA